MMYWLSCFLVFWCAYLLNIFYVTVLYHRGLTHGAVTLKPWTQKLVVWTGNWVTGLDPKGWSCMHRMHHLHADTALDPHSPLYHGTFRLFFGQLDSYNRTLRSLMKQREPYASLVADLKFSVNWLNRKHLWILPYLLHLILAFLIGLVFNAWLFGLCYWAGMMSHPIQGWMVNSFGHRFGYRNFETQDNSKNNTWVAWLVMGEGYQNNHQHKPQSAKFSVNWFEIDMGYGLCLIGKTLGLIEIPPVRAPARRDLTLG